MARRPALLALAAWWAATAVPAQPPAPAPLLPSPGAPPAAAPSPAPAGLVVEQPTARFGEAYVGTELVHTFVVRNDGSRPVRILEVQPQPPGATLPGPIAPGARADVVVRQPTQDRLGMASFRFTLKADDGLPDRRLSLSGFLQSAYDPDRAVLMGEVAPSGSAELSLGSREVDRLDVAEVTGAPPFLAVDTSTRAPDGTVRVRVTVAADAPLGVHAGTFQLRTNVPHQPTVGVAYQLRVFEDVAPGDLPVDLGLLPEGEPFEKQTLLRSRSGRAFEVKAVEGAAPGLTVEALPCAPPSPSCRALVFKGKGPGATSGRFAGSVRVVLSEGRELALAYAGLPVAAGTVVRDLGKVGTEKASSPGAEAKASPTPAPPPTPPPVPPPVQGKPGERRARLTWEASQEDQAYGFLIYRSDRREGPFRRVNPQVVPVQTGPKPHRYVYEDQDVEPGRSYFYYLESLSKAGQKSRLSGVVTKVIPPAPAP